MIAFDSFSAPVVGSLLVRVTALLALSWLGARIAARGSASMRHALWVAAFVGVLALPLAARFMPSLELPLLPAAEQTRLPAPQPAQMDASSAAPRASATPINLTPSGAARASVASAPETPQTSWMASLASITTLGWAFIAWLAIAAGLVARYLLGLAIVARITRRATEMCDGRWLDALDVATATLGIVETPRLVVSPDVSMPFTCGFMRATLVVPESAEDWSDERIDVVLRHELAHVARRDCLVQAMTQAALAVYWFHPLAWVAARHLRSERERACDDLVLATGTRGTTYAEHLLDIARSATTDSSPLAAAALAMARPSELEGRLLAILDPRRERGRASRRRILQVAAIAVVVVAPLASVTLVARGDATAVQSEASAGPAAPPVTVQAETKVIASATATSTAIATKTAKRLIEAQTATESVSHELTTILAEGGPVVGVSGGIRAGVVGGVSGGIEHGAGGSQAREGEENADERKPVSPAVVQALTEALKDSDAEVRKSAMQALARFRVPAAYDAFVAGLKDSDAEVRQQAAFALSQLRDGRATDPLMGALKDSDAEVRQQAAFALSQLRDPRAVPALTSALKDDQSDEVREQALFALSQIRDPSAVPALIGALSDPKANVRQQAAFALSQIGDEKAVPALVGALKDKDAEVREKAAFALSQIGDESAIEPLTALLKDPSSEVRQQAIFALSQLAGGERHHRTPRAVLAGPAGVAPVAPPAPVGAPTPAPAPAPLPR
jgi:HEAT repeat protein/beta-lactamase regulating signal transducer with metallopeptidase domain